MTQHDNNNATVIYTYEKEKNCFPIKKHHIKIKINLKIPLFWCKVAEKSIFLAKILVAVPVSSLD